MTSAEPVARFKELCLDSTATDGEVGRFWAAATGCEYTVSDEPGDPGDVVGDVEGKGIAICPVPEAKTVKNRVHLDLRVRSVQDLVALGASVTRAPDGEISWHVMADPEGNELCGFERDEAPSYTPFELVVDSVEPAGIGAWWAEVFGLPLEHEPKDPWHWLTAVPGTPFRYWVFNPVPEPKTVKNRLHWDVYGDVAAFGARGATVLWEMRRWTVMADPEGNEFCVFPER